MVTHQFPFFDACLVHRLLHQSTHLGIADTRRTDAQGNTLPFVLQKFANLFHQRGKTFFADAV